MELFLTLLFIGIGLGCVYGLIGLSVISVFNATKVWNFAQGSMVMLGALFAFVFVQKQGWSYWWTLPLIILIVIMIGLIINWLTVTPLLARGTPVLTIIVSTYAMFMALEGIAGIATRHAYYFVPTLMPVQSWKLGFMNIVPQYALAVMVTAVVMVLYWFFLYRTRVGWAYRATSINRDMCGLLGISTWTMIAIAFGINASIAAVAGVVVGPLWAINAASGFSLMIKGFIAAVVGGVGSPFAAVVGGIIIGVAQVLVGGYLASGYAELVVFGIFIFVLMVKPEGLLEKKGAAHGH